MRKKFQRHFEDNENKWLEGTISRGERRLLDATWLSEAIKEFYKDGGQAKVFFGNNNG